MFRNIDRILPGHGIDHQHDFIRLNGFLNRLEFIHHLFVYVQTACGIENDYIPVVQPGIFYGGPGDVQRQRLILMVYRNAGLFPQDLQLFYSRWAVYVASDQKRPTALFHQGFAQFGDSGGFTRTLQTYCHKYGRMA